MQQKNQRPDPGKVSGSGEGEETLVKQSFLLSNHKVTPIERLSEPETKCLGKNQAATFRHPKSARFLQRNEWQHAKKKSAKKRRSTAGM